MRQTQAILEDFLDDVNKEDVVQKDVSVHKDESFPFMFTARIDKEEKSKDVHARLTELIEQTSEISTYNLTIYPRQTHQDIMNQGDLDHEFMVVRFSCPSYFRTAQRAMLFISKVARLLDMLSDGSQRLLFYEFTENDKFTWISAKTSSVRLFLNFVFSTNDTKEKLSRLHDENYKLAVLMPQQIFDTVGALTHKWKETAIFIDSYIGYYDIMTKKIASYGIHGKKELKLYKQTKEYFLGKQIDTTGIWPVSQYMSNYLYVPDAIRYSDLTDKKFCYGLIDTRSDDAKREIENLEKSNPVIRIQDIRVMFSSKATSWRGFGEFQICFWLGAYETPDDKATAVYNVFLLLGGARQFIDHIVTYLEGLLNEKLPQDVIDDLFRADAALTVK